MNSRPPRSLRPGMPRPGLVEAADGVLYPNIISYGLSTAPGPRTSRGSIDRTPAAVPAAPILVPDRTTPPFWSPDLPTPNPTHSGETRAWNPVPGKPCDPRPRTRVDAPGRGLENWFTGYEAFALLTPTVLFDADRVRQQARPGLGPVA
jgi:hypothetical protein